MQFSGKISNNKKMCFNITDDFKYLKMSSLIFIYLHGCSIPTWLAFENKIFTIVTLKTKCANYANYDIIVTISRYDSNLKLISEVKEILEDQDELNHDTIVKLEMEGIKNSCQTEFEVMQEFVKIFKN